MPKILIILVVLFVLGGAGVYIARQNNFFKKDFGKGVGLQTTQWSQRKVSCEGEFFDSHAHFDGLLSASIFAPGHGRASLMPQDLAKRMNEHNVGCVVLFVAIDIEEGLNRMQESLSSSNVGFLPFFPIYDPSQLSIAKINKINEGREQVFFGIGEIGFYQGPLAGTSLTAEPWPAIFEYAAKENLFLMFHPTERQANDVEKMLSQHPNTKVILHGFESLNTGLVGKWLRTYNNLYWTYDLATMFDGYLYRIDNGADFIKWYEANKRGYLATVRSRLLPLLEAAPDRVMWGTDVVAAWHTEPEVYNHLMEFSRELVNSLPPQYQDNYAHGNAQHLFESGIVFEKQ